MAQRTQIVMTDDIDGSEAETTIKFEVGGTEYEIDLNSRNADRFQKAIAKYIEAGRKAGGTTRRSARSARANGGPSPSEVREWAKSQGIEVKDRGRVPDELVIKFKAAQ
ncbi:MAG: histone-like nucleoid-structuring protein Lsr2 [Streptosporangiaceae bacterium]